MLLSALLLVMAGGCGGGTTPPSSTAELGPALLGPGEKLRVVATTNIAGDVAGRVGGDRIELVTLMDKGVDPHSYAPTPADAAAVHDAHLLLANGAGLEEFLAEMLANAGGQAARVYLSDGLKLRQGEGERQEGTGGVDPHVWFDVRNVIAWVSRIEQALSTLDPANAAAYQANAQAYTGELEALDAWIVEQVAAVPQPNRKLVTDHPALGYLADRYGFEQVGAVYPVSPSSEPSARDLAALEKIIRELGVPAVFSENTVNPKLAEQVAKDTGTTLVLLYTGSLGGPGSGAESYVELMRYDVKAIVEALK